MYRGCGQNRDRGGGGSSAYRGGRGGSRGGRSGQGGGALKGLFADGIWQCDCAPRLPAEHFKVKKEGPNQGRWFYTCQNQEPKRCGFFLWDEDAKPREEAAVLSASRTEPLGRRSGGGEVQEGWDAGRAQRAARTDGMGARDTGIGGKGMFAQVAGRDAREDSEETASPTPSPARPVSPPPPYSLLGKSLAPASSNNGKRSAHQARMDDEDDEEFFPWPLTGQEEQDLAKAADTASLAPETPHKALKTGVYATPATTTKRKLPWLQQADVPKTPAAPLATSLDTPSKRAGAVTPIEEEQTNAPPTVAAATPSPPSRFKDALINPADSASSLTTEALAILQPCTIPPDILLQLRGVLSKHDLKLQGITKGRDISRLAIKAKDAKVIELSTKIAGLKNARIAELVARIGSLEAEREVDKAVIGQLRSQARQQKDDTAGGYDSQETIG